jgi:hypothetical protein
MATDQIIGGAMIIMGLVAFVLFVRSRLQEAKARKAAINKLAQEQAEIRVQRAYYNHRIGETWVTGKPTEETLLKLGYLDYDVTPLKKLKADCTTHFNEEDS